MASYGKHMDIPLKNIENLPINLLILWGRILEFGSISQQLAHIDYPPHNEVEESHMESPLVMCSIASNFRPHLWKDVFLVLPLYMIFGVYIYIICISILAYILSACSNSPTMKLGILPFTNCKLTAVGDYIPVYILPFRDVPSTDVNWESLQTCNSTHSNGSASMYFKSTSIKDKAINGSAFSHQISHELKSPESWRDCHDNS